MTSNAVVVKTRSRSSTFGHLRSVVARSEALLLLLAYATMLPFVNR